jgi:RES domain-containing protein
VTVTAWRIFKTSHAAAAFSGEGARLYGGRWNSAGTSVVYLAGSPSLAVLELLVHLGSHQLLQAYSLSEVRFDAGEVQDIAISDLPADWRSSPSPAALRRIGDAWVAGQVSLVLRVPSAIIDNESNFLLNPAHPAFPTVHRGAAKPFRFDPRLIKQRPSER